MPWRTLCELAPKERMTSFGMKPHEPNKGVNAGQLYCGVQLKVRSSTGEVRETKEDWRFHGQWTETDLVGRLFDHKVVGVHGYKQMDLHISHLGLILLAD